MRYKWEAEDSLVFLVTDDKHELLASIHGGHEVATLMASSREVLHALIEVTKLFPDDCQEPALLQARELISNLVSESI